MQPKTSVTTRAHGKTILIGEHVVVYGAKAIVASNALRREVKLQEGSQDGVDLSVCDTAVQKAVQRITEKPSFFDITESGDLPRGSGLGSSAAFFHAVIKAALTYAGKSLDTKGIFEEVQALETIAHANPSGVDAMSVVHGGILQFQKRAKKPSFQKLVNKEFSSKVFFLIDSGKPKESTADMVSFVREYTQENVRARMNFEKLFELSNAVTTAVADGDASMDWMQEASALLCEIGVVEKTALEKIQLLQKEGAQAKITGAGGRTNGSGFILAYHEDREKLSSFLKQKNMQYFETTLGE